MRTFFRTSRIVAAALAVAFTCNHAVAAPKKILFLSKSSGYEHSVIKRTGDQPSYAEVILKALGDKNGIEFTFTKDASLINPESFAKYDAFMFYTTLDLTQPGTDKNPPMTPENKLAFLQAIRDGKGFIGVHSATDTFHTPEDKDIGPGYHNDGDKTDPYIQMIGGEFIGHGGNPHYQPGPMLCVDRQFPGMSGVPADFGPSEEWYSMKNFSPNMHVLLIQDTSHMVKTGSCKMYDRPSYPATWASAYGKGRVFYTNMGHREEVWSDQVFQQVLLGGINWADGQVDADVTPNIDKVTPQASTLPPK